MKKKLEDFTLKELFAFCKKHESCKNCPFDDFDNLIDGYWCCIAELKNLNHGDLKEVDLDEKEN